MNDDDWSYVVDSTDDGLIVAVMLHEQRKLSLIRHF